MEYADGGDLYTLLKQYKHKKKMFTEEELWSFAYQIFLGIDYLHSNNIMHRDIKCLNLFITRENLVKIGDLGVSKIVLRHDDLHLTRVGTPLYLGPELIKNKPYDYKIDCWAVGCSIYHIANLEPPFSGDNLIELGNNICNMPHKEVSS